MIYLLCICLPLNLMVLPHLDNDFLLLFYLVGLIIDHSLHDINGASCSLVDFISLLFSCLCLHPFIIEVSCAHVFHFILLNCPVFLFDFPFLPANQILQILYFLQQFGDFLHELLTPYIIKLCIVFGLIRRQISQEIELIGLIADRTILINPCLKHQLLLFAKLLLPEFLSILVLDVPICEFLLQFIYLILLTLNDSIQIVFLLISQSHLLFCLEFL